MLNYTFLFCIYITKVGKKNISNSSKVDFAILLQKFRGLDDRNVKVNNNLYVDAFLNTLQKK